MKIGRYEIIKLSTKIAVMVNCNDLNKNDGYIANFDTAGSKVSDRVILAGSATFGLCSHPYPADGSQKIILNCW